MRKGGGGGKTKIFFFLTQSFGALFVPARDTMNVMVDGVCVESVVSACII